MLTVDEYLLKLSSSLRLDEESRRQYLISYGYLETKLWGHFKKSLDSVTLFGSFDRGTILSPKLNLKPDVDVLIIFKKNEFQPQTYLSQIQKFAETNYSRSDIFQSHPTISIEMAQIRFELVPAYWEEHSFSPNELKIPAPRKNELDWITTFPSDFKSSLESKDKEYNGMIIPLVLLLKYWNRINGNIFDSFFFEQFCVVATRSYPSCKTIKDYFFEIISDLNNAKLSEAQRKIVKDLFESRRRLKAIDENRLFEYVEDEFSRFLPMI